MPILNARKLFACLPVLTQRPPVLNNQPVFADFASHSFDDELPALGARCELQRAQQREAQRHEAERVRPRQGGQRITEDWLRSLEPREVLWQFKCVFLSLETR